jgi:hypothetical protein
MTPKRKCITYEDYIKQTETRREEEIENDRSLAVSMAIVKVMKTRKRMKFENLIE